MIVLIIWAIFTVGYIINDQVGNFKDNYLKRAYLGGQQDAVNKLITQAETCKTFNVYSGDKKVNLVSVDCLKKQQAGNNQQVNTPNNNSVNPK